MDTQTQTQTQTQTPTDLALEEEEAVLLGQDGVGRFARVARHVLT
jgi:hypothetical protein